MVVAAVLAAGTGHRFGGDKTCAILGSKTVWRWSFDTFSSHGAIDRVILVGSSGNLGQLLEAGEAILGGATRQESALAAARACAAEDTLLIHDAARPFVSSELISRVISALSEGPAAAPARPVTDTIKQVEGVNVTTLDRSRLFAVQTPQGVRRAGDLVDLLEQFPGTYTDEMSLMEAAGVPVTLVDGDERNFKITGAGDLVRASAMLNPLETRTGIGYDIHPFTDDTTRELWLGGVRFEGHRALSGHSDADVLLHAITDAILGAAVMGDIGLHFPNTDPLWAGKSSLHFLEAARDMVTGEGWNVVHVDATVIAETPKVMQRSAEIRQAIAAALGLPATCVSVKATTNEGLGSIGRSEGIAAFATATLQR
jgi:2-C-methyl-D-erythritol 4-phosphate cytidylyltransferase/2-C-methyl-D-erythritol 2,4-cyclodiphosphate synthase